MKGANPFMRKAVVISLLKGLSKRAELIILLHILDHAMFVGKAGCNPRMPPRRDRTIATISSLATGEELVERSLLLARACRDGRLRCRGGRSGCLR